MEKKKKQKKRKKKKEKKGGKSSGHRTTRTQAHISPASRAPRGARERWLFVRACGMSAPKKKARIVFDVGDEAAGGSAGAPAAAAGAGAPAAPAAGGAKKGVAFADAPAPAASASAAASVPAPAPEAGVAVQDLATLDVSALTPLTPAILSRQVRGRREAGDAHTKRTKSGRQRGKRGRQRDWTALSALFMHKCALSSTFRLFLPSSPPFLSLSSPSFFLGDD